MKNVMIMFMGNAKPQTLNLMILVGYVNLGSAVVSSSSSSSSSSSFFIVIVIVIAVNRKP